MDVIKLLRSKNRCLQRLLDLSSRFLDGNDPDKLDNELDPYQRQRDAIFRALDLYDRKVTEALARLPSEARTLELAGKVKPILAEKERLIQTLILKDNELMNRIEEKKLKLLDEIASSRKSKELVGKFKSGWVSESGEELDQKL